MTDVTLPLLLLALVVLVHFTFVNINIGLGVFSLALRWRSISRPEYEEVARRAFKFLAASEIVSGVYGTMITVVLAGLWPTLVNIATIVLFIPLYISLIGIILRMTSIVTYWYSWDRIGPYAHMGVGIIMVASGFMIPAGFRYIFAIIDKPVGVLNLVPIKGDPLLALSNPIYPPLLLHTWLGALSIGLFAAATGFAWSSKIYPELKRWAGQAALMGALMVIPQGLAGFWLWSSLAYHSPYLFYSINGTFLPFGESMTDVFPAFLGMMLLAMLLLAAGLIYFQNPERRRLAYMLAPMAVLTMMLGEIAHDWGRVPYMVITGEKGVPAELFVNKLVTIDLPMLATGLIPILIITTGFIVLMYFYLAKGFLE